jgi:Holliday junction resolvase
MATEYQFTLPYPPSANVYWRTNRHGHTYVSEEAVAYKREAGYCAILGGCDTPLQGELIVYLDAYRPAKRGDLDNTIKVTLDSLNGIAYLDDQQVVEIHARRFDDKKNPRMEVIVRVK